MTAIENRAASGEIDAAAFRSALGRFPTGVAVVTAECPQGTGPVGMTITSFNSVSVEPPLVLFSIGKKALSLRTLSIAPMYSVNVLGESHREVSSRFARALSDKWAGVEVDSHEGLPFTLRDSIVSFQCEQYAQYEGGDHVIFVGRVLRIHTASEARPLVFFGGGYATVHHPAEGVHA